MIVAQVRGGLGNQLFQYSAARRLADHRGTGLELDLSWFDDPGDDTPRRFMLDELMIRARLRRGRLAHGLRVTRRVTHTVHRERGFAFDPAVLELPGRAILSGYFQSFRYFVDNRDRILRDVRPSTTGSAGAARVAARIDAAPCAVSVHVRRGDYVSNDRAAQVLGALDNAYYQRALATLPAKREVFVFSDDIAWCRGHLDLGEPTHFVEETASEIEDLFLMAACRHNVLANSSFSWWAGWLNDAPGTMIVAPAIWSADGTLDVSDLIPDSWKRV